MKRLFLFLVLLASSLLAANATVVTGRVTFDYYGYPQSVNSGTVTLNQDGSVVYSASVVNGYDPAVSSYSARYTIDAVESGTYTIVFRGLGSGNVKTYSVHDGRNLRGTVFVQLPDSARRGGHLFFGG